jgi:aldehyde dehydrogenase family 7 protein A1
MEQEFTYSQYPFLKDLGLEEDNHGCYDGKKWSGNGETILALNPTSGKVYIINKIKFYLFKKIAKIRMASLDEYERCIKNMEEVTEKWFALAMPKRGLIIQEIGDSFKKYKKQLGSLITLEMGKILSEGEGEIQEIIDIIDYAVGLSRTIGGKTLGSERDDHQILENWNPLGLIGVITAFNFPAAVLGWNAAISMVCGNLSIWKGSETTNLISIAVTKIFTQVLEKWNFGPVFTMCCGVGKTIGEKIVNDDRLKLISFTGSCQVGKYVSGTVHNRFGRTILELGGNNAMCVMEDGDQNLALSSAVFAAVGTAGQRCTSLRRLVNFFFLIILINFIL